MNNLDVIDEAMSLIVRGHYDAAIGVLWRFKNESREMTREETYASTRDSIRTIAGVDQLREARASVALDGDTYSLPPMVPINGKKKRISPNTVIKVSCPRCGAQAGYPCFGFTMSGRNGVVDHGKTIATFHTARTEKAKAKVKARDNRPEQA